jgi:hypothetical protein
VRSTTRWVVPSLAPTLSTRARPRCSSTPRSRAVVAPPRRLRLPASTSRCCEDAWPASPGIRICTLYSSFARVCLQANSADEVSLAAIDVAKLLQQLELHKEDMPSAVASDGTSVPALEALEQTCSKLEQNMERLEAQVLPCPPSSTLQEQQQLQQEQAQRASSMRDTCPSAVMATGQLQAYHAATKIQSWYRSCAARRLNSPMLLSSTDSRRLQQAAGPVHGAGHAELAVTMATGAWTQHEAATKIQAWYRGCAARNVAGSTELVAQDEDEDRSSTLAVSELATRVEALARQQLSFQKDVATMHAVLSDQVRLRTRTRHIGALIREKRERERERSAPITRPVRVRAADR